MSQGALPRHVYLWVTIRLHTLREGAIFSKGRVWGELPTVGLLSSKLSGIAIATSFALWAMLPASAQQATPPYGPISLEQALKVITAAEAEAKKNNWPVVITVVDSGAHVVAMHRLDNTQLGSIAVAEDKARSVVLYRRPTKAFEDGLAGGGLGLRILALRGANPVDGGVPIMVDGKLIGAVGVSGVLAPQDAQIATAGANVLK